MKRTLIAFACVMGLAAPAAAAVLDFDTGTPTFSGNDPSTNILTGYSVEISPGNVMAFDLSFTGSGTTGPNLFNTLNCEPGGTAGETSCAGNDDGDLVPRTQGERGVAGNVLILQETGNDLDDDSSNGGTITFTLVSGPLFRVVGFSSIDDEEIDLLVGGVKQAGLTPADNRDTLSASFLSPVTNSFTIQYFGSGGVDSIRLQPVPLPAGVWLMLAGIGGLAGLRRMRGRA